MKKDKLDIVYEDHDLIVVNKKSGMLTISTLTENQETLYQKVSEYVKKQNKNNKIFIVHRLDRDTSGLIIFAKNKKVKEILQNNWSLVKRKYYGIVFGNPKNKDILINNLAFTKTNLTYIAKYGKKAILEYKKLKNNKLYSLLEINLITGRKHQIRVQLNNIGCPLVGDKLYNKKDKNKYLYLHAYYLEFKHPISNKTIILETKYPNYFDNLMA